MLNILKILCKLNRQKTNNMYPLMINAPSRKIARILRYKGTFFISILTICMQESLYRTERGCRTSVSQSPTKLMARTVSRIAMPGQVETHQALER